MPAIRDLAAVRLDNALLLFDEFVRAAAAKPDAATLRGLERRFAERLQIQPSYWSQIKSRSRQIGERLARQFEHLCRKPHGWMDTPHGASTVPGAATASAAGSTPEGDDERFIVGLVLTYYRRHPQRARARLLDLLGEVLVPDDAAVATRVAGSAAPRTPGPRSSAAQAAPTPTDDRTLWDEVTTRVSPLPQGRKR